MAAWFHSLSIDWWFWFRKCLLTVTFSDRGSVRSFEMALQENKTASDSQSFVMTR
jgi:hypothetical protein